MADQTYSVALTLGNWQVLQVIASTDDIGRIIGMMLPEIERRLTDHALNSCEMRVWKAPQ